MGSLISQQTLYPPDGKKSSAYSNVLIDMGKADAEIVLKRMQTQLTGLNEDIAHSRLEKYGLNEVAREKRRSAIVHLLSNIKNPLVMLLSVLAIISYLTGDIRSTVIIAVMILLGVVLRFYQEWRADDAAEKLKAMISSSATVIRDGVKKEIPIKMLVPGDIITLGAGDMVPADVRILSAKDLFLNQAMLTGEAMPVEKYADPVHSEDGQNPLDYANLGFLGSNVVSGTGLATVIHTGDITYFGSLAESLVVEREMTSFDKGIKDFTWMMIRFVAIMVPVVFLLNAFSKHNLLEAFLFAMAVAVGLTPEMMPMIVSVNLSKGAIMMSRKKVIVKRLNAIQNLGAMDVLCTDKTGTITLGKIILQNHLDVQGETSAKVLHYGYLNSYHHTGLKNLMDEAILNHGELEEDLEADTKYHKIDEIPFDFVRRRMSVIVEDNTGLNTLICKGAVEEIFECCSYVELGRVLPMQQEYKDKAKTIVHDLNNQGFRVIALAYKEIPDAPDEPVYEIKDETDLILLGFLAFLDPPKKSAADALKRLNALNVKVKILTGDSDIITAYICKEVGLPADKILLGSQIAKMGQQELIEAVNATSIFAKLAPNQKEQIVNALQHNGHVVGFLGDGINDSPALKTADVSVSVDSAVDIAKESSDIILLDQDLLVLEQGVIEGRRVFGNIIKYIKMAASSNFGNMFSVVGASAFLPFLPMLPIQILTNNLLYDFSQTTIPMDEVDSDWLKKPHQWKMNGIQKFILFIGPISSIFDYLTFFIMLNVFHCWNNPTLFHTGWFVESIFTQTLIIHIIRTNRIPFIESMARWPLLVSSLVIVSVAAFLTVSPLAPALGFVPLPALYWVLLGLMMIGYIFLTQMVKTWFIRRYGD